MSRAADDPESPALPVLWEPEALRIATLLRRRVGRDVRQWMRDHARGARHRRDAQLRRRAPAEPGEVGALIRAGLGPALLADIANTSLELLLELFPTDVVLAPSPRPPGPALGPLLGADPDQVTVVDRTGPCGTGPAREDFDLLGHERAAAAALVEQARARAAADYALGLLHTDPDTDRCPACIALDAVEQAAENAENSAGRAGCDRDGAEEQDGAGGDVAGPAADPAAEAAVASALLDVRVDGGELTDLDVAVELGLRGVRQGNLRDRRWIGFQHTVLDMLLDQHGDRLAELYRQMGWAPDHVADPSCRGW